MGARRRSAVVTGIGPVTESGIGGDALLRGLRAGRSPVAEVTLFDAGPFRSRVAAEVADFSPTAFMTAKRARRADRFVQFSLASTELAIRDTELADGSFDPRRCAVQIGSSTRVASRTRSCGSAASRRAAYARSIPVSQRRRSPARPAVVSPSPTVSAAPTRPTRRLRGRHHRHRRGGPTHPIRHRRRGDRRGARLRSRSYATEHSARFAL